MQSTAHAIFVGFVAAVVVGLAAGALEGPVVGGVAGVIVLLVVLFSMPTPAARYAIRRRDDSPAPNEAADEAVAQAVDSEAGDVHEVQANSNGVRPPSPTST